MTASGFLSFWRGNSFFLLLIFLAAGIFYPPRVHGASRQTYIINLKKHRFDPNHLIVPKNQPFTLHVTNGDNHPEEFESYDLEFEIIVLPHHYIDVPVRPLPPGTYEFFGDFHPRTARGTITVHP